MVVLELLLGFEDGCCCVTATYRTSIFGVGDCKSLFLLVDVFVKVSLGVLAVRALDLAVGLGGGPAS